MAVRVRLPEMRQHSRGTRPTQGQRRRLLYPVYRAHGQPPPEPDTRRRKERVLRCECFTPIPEDEEGENEKCKECEYAKAYNVPRNGNGASWRSGHFSQKGYVCSHKDGESKLPIIFYGETAPRKCPLRNGGQK